MHVIDRIKCALGVGQFLVSDLLRLFLVPFWGPWHSLVPRRLKTRLGVAARVGRPLCLKLLMPHTI